MTPPLGNSNGCSKEKATAGSSKRQQGVGRKKKCEVLTSAEFL